MTPPRAQRTVPRSAAAAVGSQKPAFPERHGGEERCEYPRDEILGDKIGHVGYVASLLGPAGRTVMRGLHRVLGLRLAYEMPDLVAVLGRDEIARRFRAEFRVDEMAAELPGCAYAAATI